MTEAVLRVLEARQRAAFIACTEFTSGLKKRVFNQGLDATGQKIGSYSTKPYYQSIEGSKTKYGSQIKNSALKPKGKYGDKKHLDGSDYRTQYMERGYAEFRETVGRQSKSVDLFLTGSLSGAIKQGDTTDGGQAVSFNNPDIAKQARDLEKQFGKQGKIFVAGANEVEAIKSMITQEITRAFYSAFEE